MSDTKQESEVERLWAENRATWIHEPTKAYVVNKWTFRAMLLLAVCTGVFLGFVLGVAVAAKPVAHPTQLRTAPGATTPPATAETVPLAVPSAPMVASTPSTVFGPAQRATGTPTTVAFTRSAPAQQPTAKPTTTTTPTTSPKPTPTTAPPMPPPHLP